MGELRSNEVEKYCSVGCAGVVRILCNFATCRLGVRTFEGRSIGISGRSRFRGYGGSISLLHSVLPNHRCCLYRAGSSLVVYRMPFSSPRSQQGTTRLQSRSLCTGCRRSSLVFLPVRSSLGLLGGIHDNP